MVAGFYKKSYVAAVHSACALFGKGAALGPVVARAGAMEQCPEGALGDGKHRKYDVVPRFCRILWWR